MALEVGTPVQRAAVAHYQLLGLAETIPPDWWGRSAPGGGWSGRDHLAHLAASDGSLTPLVAGAADVEELSLGGGIGIFARGQRALAVLSDRGLDGLLATVASERERLLTSLN